MPGYEYASQNSEGERAAWFVKAYQMSKNWGFVGVVFLWNLDFRIVAPGSEQALFGILDMGFVCHGNLCGPARHAQVGPGFDDCRRDACLFWDTHHVLL